MRQKLFFGSFLAAFFIVFSLQTNIYPQTPEQTDAITSTNCPQGYDGGSPQTATNDGSDLSSPQIPCSSISDSAIVGACGCINGVLGDGSINHNTTLCSTLKAKAGY